MRPYEGYQLRVPMSKKHSFPTQDEPHTTVRSQGKMKMKAPGQPEGRTMHIVSSCYAGLDVHQEVSGSVFYGISRASGNSSGCSVAIAAA
jgi:hypothetical protein